MHVLDINVSGIPHADVSLLTKYQGYASFKFPLTKVLVSYNKYIKDT